MSAKASADAGRAASPTAAVDPVLEAWEVFRQEKDGDPMRHGGSVMAPDAELATSGMSVLFDCKTLVCRACVLAAFSSQMYPGRHSGTIATATM